MIQSLMPKLDLNWGSVNDLKRELILIPILDHLRSRTSPSIMCSDHKSDQKNPKETAQEICLKNVQRNLIPESTSSLTPNQEVSVTSLYHSTLHY